MAIQSSIKSHSGTPRSQKRQVRFVEHEDETIYFAIPSQVDIIVKPPSQSSDDMKSNFLSGGPKSHSGTPCAQRRPAWEPNDETRYDAIPSQVDSILQPQSQSRSRYEGKAIDDMKLTILRNQIANTQGTNEESLPVIRASQGLYDPVDALMVVSGKNRFHANTELRMISTNWPCIFMGLCIAQFTTGPARKHQACNFATLLLILLRSEYTIGAELPFELIDFDKESSNTRSMSNPVKVLKRMVLQMFKTRPIKVEVIVIVPSIH
jgi:hypothetical protein